MGDIADAMIDNYLDDNRHESPSVWLSFDIDGVERETELSYGCRIKGKLIWFSKKYCVLKTNNIVVPFWLVRKMGIGYLLNPHTKNKEDAKDIKYLRKQLLHTMSDEMVAHCTSMFGQATTNAFIDQVTDEDQNYWADEEEEDDEG